MNRPGGDTPEAEGAEQAFRHEALIYAGPREFVDGLVPYLREGLAAGETAAVLLEADKIAILREALGEDADRVHFADAARVGRNPARLIPWWRDFVGEHLHPGRPVRGVEEPRLAGRRPAELDEYTAHETLLNAAFTDTPAWSLLCLYDVDVLASEFVEGVTRSHPFVVHEGTPGPNGDYHADTGPSRLDRPLPPPPAGAEQLEFGSEQGALRRVRAAVLAHAADSGLDDTATDHLLLAVNELASNSLNHGGGRGTMRLWRDGGVAVCEVSDSGLVPDQPLLGRERPDLTRPGGRGLWLVNQVCDLVQVRRSPAGTTIRVHMWPASGGSDREEP